MLLRVRMSHYSTVPHEVGINAFFCIRISALAEVILLRLARRLVIKRYRCPTCSGMYSSGMEDRELSRLT